VIVPLVLSDSSPTLLLFGDVRCNMRCSRSFARCRFTSSSNCPDGLRPPDTVGITGSGCSTVCSGVCTLSAVSEILGSAFCTATLDVDGCSDKSPDCDGLCSDTFVADTSVHEAGTCSWTADGDVPDEPDGCKLLRDVGDLSADDTDTDAAVYEDGTDELGDCKFSRDVADFSSNDTDTDAGATVYEDGSDELDGCGLLIDAGDFSADDTDTDATVYKVGTDEVVGCELSSDAVDFLANDSDADVTGSDFDNERFEFTFSFTV